MIVAIQRSHTKPDHEPVTQPHAPSRQSQHPLLNLLFYFQASPSATKLVRLSLSFLSAQGVLLYLRLGHRNTLSFSHTAGGYMKSKGLFAVRTHQFSRENERVYVCNVYMYLCIWIYGLPFATVVTRSELGTCAWTSLRILADKATTSTMTPQAARATAAFRSLELG